MLIIGGPASNNLENEIADIIGMRSLKVDYKIFPDGESYIRFPEKLEEDIVLIQSLFPPQDKHLIELFLMIDTAYNLGAERVIVVVPYMAYSRQDKRFLEGEAISIESILKIIEKLGTKYFLTVDIHKENSLKILSIPYTNIVPTVLFAEKIQELNLDNIVILSPDAGGIGRVRDVAEKIGCEYDFLEKRRDRISGEVRLRPKNIDVANKNIVIIDDIISTGGTISLAAKQVIKNGARSVYVLCTHALLINNAVKKILSSGVKEIIATNTIPNIYSKISVAPLIASVLNNLFK